MNLAPTPPHPPAHAMAMGIYRHVCYRAALWAVTYSPHHPPQVATFHVCFLAPGLRQRLWWRGSRSNVKSALLRLRLRKNEILSNDFPKYFRISGILQYHDSSNNKNNSPDYIDYNVSGKMKSREILKLVLTFFPVADCLADYNGQIETIGDENIRLIRCATINEEVLRYFLFKPLQSSLGLIFAHCTWRQYKAERITHLMRPRTCQKLRIHCEILVNFCGKRGTHYTPGPTPGRCGSVCAVCKGGKKGGETEQQLCASRKRAEKLSPQALFRCSFDFCCFSFCCICCCRRVEKNMKRKFV